MNSRYFKVFQGSFFGKGRGSGVEECGLWNTEASRAGSNRVQMMGDFRFEISDLKGIHKNYEIYANFENLTSKFGVI